MVNLVTVSLPPTPVVEGAEFTVTFSNIAVPYNFVVTEIVLRGEHKPPEVATES